MRGGTVVQIEDKKEIHKRLGRSPDKADSLVCLFRAVFQKFQLHSMFQRPVRIMAGTASDFAKNHASSDTTQADREELVQVQSNTVDSDTNRTTFMTEDPPEPSQRFMSSLADVVNMLEGKIVEEEERQKQRQFPFVSAESRELQEEEERRARKLRRLLED